ncbi:MAG: 1-acyl-sn-glycerol-3-phosphate acyltransferase [Acidobacteria bacterium]|nr:1-acyl-sn-glycerol-3-phosphate acyltransferase [Acidobacteriota bacterium]
MNEAETSSPEVAPEAPAEETREAPRSQGHLAIQPFVTYTLVTALKVISRLFYRGEYRWVGDPPPNPWQDIRLVAILNHTSLFEWLWAGSVPQSFIRRMARHGVVPVAEKTTQRPLVGQFFRLVARNVVAVTRKRDHTWKRVLDQLEGDTMVVMLPEGRMKRANGLDLHGNPMTIRGGIADVLKALPDGRFLLAYSGGLHHVQHPGQTFPRLFQTIRMNFEVVDIRDYRRELLERHGEDGFRHAVIADLERRRDTHCPPETTPSRG